MLLLPNNSLLYPGGVPGFDPLHVAAYGLVYSGIAANQGGGFINLLNGARATATGTITSVIDGVIGPSSNYGAANAYNAVSTSAPGTRTAYTTAAIIGRITALNISRAYMTAGASGNGTGLFVDTTSGYVCIAGTNNAFTFNFLTGNPYFIAASYSSTLNIAHVVVVDLSTGKITQFTFTATGTIDGPTTYNIGGWNQLSGREFNGNIAAVMISYNNYLSSGQLYQWAQNPWAFWYPFAFDVDDFIVGATAFTWLEMDGKGAAFPRNYWTREMIAHD